MSIWSEGPSWFCVVAGGTVGGVAIDSGWDGGSGAWGAVFFAAFGAFGSERRNWIAVEVDGIDEFAPESETSATGPAHWRPQEES